MAKQKNSKPSTGYKPAASSNVGKVQTIGPKPIRKFNGPKTSGKHVGPKGAAYYEC